MVARASALGWRTDRVNGDHEIMATDPGLLVGALLGLLPHEAMPKTPQGVR
jgi:hypothetical protein